MPTSECVGHEMLLRIATHEQGADITFTDDGLHFRMRMPPGPAVLAE
jgi:hypothetical protein